MRENGVRSVCCVACAAGVDRPFYRADVAVPLAPAGWASRLAVRWVGPLDRVRLAMGDAEAACLGRGPAPPHDGAPVAARVGVIQGRGAIA